MMSNGQRVHMMAELWPNACKAQGWNKSDAEKRYEVFARVLTAPGHVNCGKHLQTIAAGEHISFNSFDNADFDAVKKELLHLADVIPSPTSGAVRGEKERMLWKIRNEQVKCIAVYRGNFASYINKILRDRFKRTVDVNTLADMPTEDVRKAMMTFAGRINYLRKEAGDTIHDMKMKAKLPCDCAICQPRRRAVVLIPADPSDNDLPEGVEIPESTAQNPF